MPKVPRVRSPSPRATPYTKCPKPVRDAIRKGRGATPYKMDVACLVTSSHTKRTVHPYIREDVETAKRVSLQVWVRAALGLPEDQFVEWVRHIADNDWYKDEVIEEALIAFARASVETERYEPFAKLGNRIFELAKEELPGVDSFPINDIEMIRNDPVHLNRTPEDDVLGAKRKPDLLVVRGSKIRTLRSTKSMAFDWTDVLLFLEMKREKPLVETLLAWRKTQGLPGLDPRTLLPLGSTQPMKSGAAKKSAAAPIPTRTLRPRPPAKPPVKSKRELDSDDESVSDGDSTGPKKQRITSSELVTMDAKLQAGGYALEIASCTYGTRLFSTGVVLEDDRTSLWYYDAAGVVRTQETLSLFGDFEKVAAILVAFACCEPSQWGSLPPSIVTPPSSAPYPKHFPPKNLKGHTLEMRLPITKEKVLITLGKPIFTQYNLVGRRTFLYEIKTDSKTLTKPMVAKFSYQVTTRKAEQKLLRRAKKAGVKHLPEVHMWKDFWKLSEGARAIFHEHDKDDQYEDRVFRGLVYTQYFPLKELFSKSCELIPRMVDQMLDCLHDLRYKAKILHRDISCNNVMFEMRGTEVNFILIDYDWATLVDGEGHPIGAIGRSKHRTGTLPFMAFDLVADMAKRDNPGYQPIAHLLRHDYESLYYVSIFCGVSYPNMKRSTKARVYKTVVKLWESGPYEAIASVKELLCRKQSYVKHDLPLPPSSEFLRPYFVRFCRAIRRAYLVADAEDSDDSDDSDDEDVGQGKTRAPRSGHETLGGLLSRDSIKKALAGKARKVYIKVEEDEEPPVAAETSGDISADESDSEDESIPITEMPKRAVTKGTAKKATVTKSAPANLKAVATKGTNRAKPAIVKAATGKQTVRAKEPPMKRNDLKVQVVITSKAARAQNATTKRGATTRSMTKAR
ncbi:hypothetical protein EW026_g7196 [Hermanssonia centrifuga]|uniref:Fungal-type protein kinase domain-containing protein n=1 Tax=Hermanssonia centrifuga TaxID=98765 RepID=A0A4S4K8K8_9APHY|nr:hypothetical protein EW026_g7196 [Hermanssonia centrifuga]